MARLLLPSLCAASLSGALFAQTPEQAADALGLHQADVVSVQLTGLPGAPAMATFDIEGVPTLVELEPHSIRSENFRLIEHRGGDLYVDVPAQIPLTYRGFVPSMPGATVRASWLGDGLHLRLRLEDGSDLWLEPLQDKVPGSSPDSHALYRSSDVIPGYGECGTDSLAGSAQSHGGSAGGSGEGILNPQGLLVAELALDADFEYFQSKGSSSSNTQAQMENVINAMNPQYEQDAGITHVISGVIVRTNSNDPYTTTNPSSFLSQFTNHWNSQQGAIPRDVAQLFTGKNLSGSVIGIAWLNGICQNDGYNLVQSDCCGGLATKTDLSAHELGHNWNQDHCSCTNFTMNSFLTAGNQFHPTFTIPSLVNYAANRPCLDDGVTPPTGGPSVITNVSPSGAQIVVPDGQTVTVSGSGFSNITKVTVGGVELSTFPPQYQIVDDTTVTFTLPQFDTLGNKVITFEDPEGNGTGSINIVSNVNPTVDLVNSNPGFLLSAIGAEVNMSAQPGDVLLLLVSPDLGATVIPGLFTSGLGNGDLNSLILVGTFTMGANTFASVTVPFSGLPIGFSVNFEALHLDASSPSLPLGASNIQSGTVLL